MKIILILLALTSLFFTVLGSFGVVCHGNEESCGKNKEDPSIVTCKSGYWKIKEMCPENHYCDPGPPVTCKENHANARSFDDAASANDGDSSHVAVACQDYEEKCNTDTRRPAILQCKSGVWDTKQWCLAAERYYSGPPVVCKKRYDARSFHNTPSATYATSPADPCASTDAATATLPGHHIYTASLIHTASHADTDSLSLIHI